MDEFSLIRRYFATSPLAGPRADVVAGIGDDCALLVPPATGHVLAVSVDTLVEGVHFFADVDPFRLGHKALAVNLSDLAAAGARPRWFTLALTLPDANAAWLDAFSAGLSALATASGIVLVGGDTTRGPRSITIQVMGDVTAADALCRHGASSGDDVWVSGVIGRAGLGLLVRQAQRGGGWAAPDPAMVADCIDALECPVPRLSLGSALVGVASACIDVSDGLLQDLGHVLTASGVGASLDIDAIPVPSWAPWQASVSAACGDAAAMRAFALRAGDDYELCFTAPALRRDAVLAAAQQTGVAVTRIGSIVAGNALVDAGSGQRLQGAGFRHFEDGGDPESVRT